jgi:hypothetical protein
LIGLATDMMDRAFSQVGVKPRSHPKILHNKATSLQVHLRWADESDHIVNVHGCTVPKSTNDQLRKQPILDRSLKHPVKDIHDRIKEQENIYDFWSILHLFFDNHMMHRIKQS